MALRWEGGGATVRRRVETLVGPLGADVTVLHVLRYRGAAVRALADLVGRAPVVVLVRDWDLAEAQGACMAGALACLEDSAAPSMIADAVSAAGAGACASASTSAAARRPSSRQAAA